MSDILQPDAIELPELSLLPQELLSRARTIDLAADAVLFRRGRAPAAIHCLLSGEVALVRHSRAGREVVLQRTRRGFFAEASIDAAAYHCDAVAVVPSRVVAVPLTPFRAALEGDARFRAAWSAHLAAELRRLRNRCERLALPTAAERLIHYIESEGRDGRIGCPQGLKRLAAELGITHEALYRAVARLERDGTLGREDRRELRLLR